MPVASLELGIPRTETSVVKITLPEGWNAEMPEAVHAHATFATVDVTFSVKNGVVTGKRIFTVLQPRVPAADWKTYKAWYEQAGVNTYPFLELKPGTANHPGSLKPRASGGAEDNAGKLVTVAERR